MITIKGRKKLGQEILQWHTGQTSPTYAVGSSFVAGREVEVRTILAARDELIESGNERLAKKLMRLCQLKPKDAGCYADSARGIYAGEIVIEFALSYGLELGEEDEPNTKSDGEFYTELWDEAEDYLQQFAPDGYYFGSSEAGDWGLWKNKEGG